MALARPTWRSAEKPALFYCCCCYNIRAMHLLLWILLLFLLPGTAAQADQQGIVVRQAGVLAPEIAHVVRKQHLKALQKNMKLGMWGDLTVAGVDDKQDRDKMCMLINSGLQLYTTGLDREYEFEVDSLAVVLTARADCDPCTFLDVLTTIDSINPDSVGLTVLYPPTCCRLPGNAGQENAR